MKETINTKSKIPFTQIANSVLNDKNLSIKAKGLFSYIYSKPNGWNFSAHRISSDHKDGVDSIKSAIRELEDAGYLCRSRKPDGRVLYDISWKPKVGKPSMGKTLNGKTHHIINKDNTSNKEKNRNKERKLEANASLLEKKPTTMKRNSLGSHNEERHSDEYDTAIDLETGEVVGGKPKPTGKNKVAISLQKKFIDLAYERTGTKPVMNSAGYNICLFALRNLTEAQVSTMIDEWFDRRRPDEEIISITRALSGNQINEFKIRNGI